MAPQSYDGLEKNYLIALINSSEVIAPGIGIAGRLFKKAAVLTHPTPARRDALSHGQGRSEREGLSPFRPATVPF